MKTGSTALDISSGICAELTVLGLDVKIQVDSIEGSEKT